jgi:hypothetical protein
MDLNEVKVKAGELRASIEKLLTDFRRETGYTPGVTIETKSQRTNDGDKVHQRVNISLNVS